MGAVTGGSAPVCCLRIIFQHTIFFFTFIIQGVDPNSLFEDVKDEPENEQESEGQLQQGPDGELKIRIKKSEAFEVSSKIRNCSFPSSKYSFLAMIFLNIRHCTANVDSATSVQAYSVALCKTLSDSLIMRAV